jgi:hypothetical protein
MTTSGESVWSWRLDQDEQRLLKTSSTDFGVTIRISNKRTDHYSSESDLTRIACLCASAPRGLQRGHPYRLDGVRTVVSYSYYLVAQAKSSVKQEVGLFRGLGATAASRRMRLHLKSPPAVKGVTGLVWGGGAARGRSVRLPLDDPGPSISC